MKVVFTGATGFVGSHMCRRFANAGHEVIALVRPEADRSRLPENVIQFAEGDITKPESLEKAFDGCEAVVHLVGIIKETQDATFQKIHVEGTRNVIEAAQKAGVSRLIHMSALGTRENAESQYHITKWEAEKLVHESGLKWTILRPSLIFGPGDGFTTMLIDIMRKSPVIPVIGQGENLMQPIAVEDVTAVFLAVAEGEEHIGQIYFLGGPEQFAYKRIVIIMARQMGMHKPTVHMPVNMMRPVASFMTNLLPSFPLTPDQLKMLQEDNIAEPNHAVDVFQLKLTPFQEGLKKILAGKTSPFTG